MMKAFPHEEWLDSTDPKVLNPIRHPGMDLRDYFAAKAMQALLTTGNTTTVNGEDVHDSDEYAKVAYIMADNMMEARNGN
jgi:MoaA/NifB/PqqE/SkfB family radical SAM enzyme